MRCALLAGTLWALPSNAEWLGEKIDLMGLLYGTTVVQTYMREYPQNLRCAVLIGTAPIGELIYGSTNASA